jgi:hypothetical protein
VVQRALSTFVIRQSGLTVSSGARTGAVTLIQAIGSLFYLLRSRRRPAAPGWVSRGQARGRLRFWRSQRSGRAKPSPVKRAAPEGACADCMPSSAAGFRRRRKKGSETPLRIKLEYSGSIRTVHRVSGRGRRFRD